MKLQESTTGFYYVGTKRANITKLVNIYKHGYASGKFNQAMTELSKEEIQPDVICCDSCYGFAAIKQLAGFMSGDEKLSKIPLIVDAGRKTTFINFRFIHNRTVDDILNLQEWDENRLSSKIRFLQKLKVRNGELKQKQKEVTIKMNTGAIHIFLKRSFDILFSFTALIFLSPLFLIIALALRIGSKGNIFYVSRRYGTGYRIFNLYKFRTVIPGNDPRVPRLGWFLRRSGLEDLPQLFNILLGDISLTDMQNLTLYEAENFMYDSMDNRNQTPVARMEAGEIWSMTPAGQAWM